MPSTLGIVASSQNFPLSLSPALWLDAADTATITESGGSVSQWNNKGLLSNFTQATGASQPTTGVSTVNGLNVLDFSTDFLTAVNQNEWKFLHDGTDWIIGVVWQAAVSANPNTNYVLLGNNGISSASVGAAVYYDDRSGFGFNDASRSFVSRGVGGQPTCVTVDNNYHPANQLVVLTAQFDLDNPTAADRAIFQVNGNTTAASNTDTNAPSSANPTYGLQIGAHGNNGSVLTGKIAEIVVVSGTNATTANREILRDYLNNKWNIY